MMVIVETPDDAAYQFQHPARRPTVIGTAMARSVGAPFLSAKRAHVFFPTGNYVTLAKRYRNT